MKKVCLLEMESVIFAAVGVMQNRLTDYKAFFDISLDFVNGQRRV